MALASMMPALSLGLSSGAEDYGSNSLGGFAVTQASKDSAPGLLDSLAREYYGLPLFVYLGAAAALVVLKRKR